MKFLGFVILGLFLAGPALGQTSPTPTAAPGIPGMTFEHGPAVKYREKFHEPVRCLEGPPELFHPAPKELAELVPQKASVAGAGPYLGAVFKDPKGEGYVFRLFRNEKLVQELFLHPHGFQVPERGLRLVLARDGEYLALVTPQAFAVFAGSTQVGLFQDSQVNAPEVAFAKGQVLWCRHPMGLRERWPKPGEEPYAVCYRSELDGSSREPLFSLEDDVRSLAPNDNPADYYFSVSLRRDGKLWLVDNATGNIFLASSTGARLRKWTFPFALERDLEAERELQEWFVGELSAKLGPRLHDATKPREKFEGKTTVNISVLSRASAAGNDLLLVTNTGWKPANAVFWVSSDLRQARCFAVDKLAEKAPGASSFDKYIRLAFTDDALWLREPFGYILWQDLLALEEPGERDAPGKAPPPPGQ